MAEDTEAYGRNLGIWERAAVAVLGGAAWGVAGTAMFVADGDVASATLLVIGAVLIVTALYGRLPTRVGGNGADWSINEFIRRTQASLEPQIEAAPEAAASALGALWSALGEAAQSSLTTPHRRTNLGVLAQAWGSGPARYDLDASAAFARLFPGSRLERYGVFQADRPDYVFTYQGQQLLVETKFVSGSAEFFRGRTLSPLLDELPSKAKLLVLSNAQDVEQASTVVAREIGERGRVIRWRSPSDDIDLAAAVKDLIKE